MVAGIPAVIHTTDACSWRTSLCLKLDFLPIYHYLVSQDSIRIPSSSIHRQPAELLSCFFEVCLHLGMQQWFNVCPCQIESACQFVSMDIQINTLALDILCPCQRPSFMRIGGIAGTNNVSWIIFLFNFSLF